MNPKLYYGKHCKHHVALQGERYVSTGQCTACIKAANKRWHDARKARLMYKEACEVTNTKAA